MLQYTPWGIRLAGFYFHERGSMVEFTSADGTSYEMPELDAALYAKQEAVDIAENMETRFSAAWAFIRAALPDECVMAEIGTTEKRKAGVPRIMTLYHRVKAAYWEEYNDDQRAQIGENMEAIKGIPEAVDAIVKAQALAKKQGNRQAFRIAN